MRSFEDKFVPFCGNLNIRIMRDKVKLPCLMTALHWCPSHYLYASSSIPMRYVDIPLSAHITKLTLHWNESFLTRVSLAKASKALISFITEGAVVCVLADGGGGRCGDLCRTRKLDCLGIIGGIAFNGITATTCGIWILWVHFFAQMRHPNKWDKTDHSSCLRNETETSIGSVETFNCRKISN